MSAWLITGGAGYIGAHVVLALKDAGMSPVVIDDLSHTYPREENGRILQWFEPDLALSD